MLELFKQEQPELLLGEFRVNEREGYGLEGQVPRGEPWILPFVRHGEDAFGIQVPPVNVADIFSRFGGRRTGIVAVQPFGNIEEINLFAPKQAGERLTLDAPFIFSSARRMNRCIKLVGFRPAHGNDFIDVRKRPGHRFVRQPQAQDDGAAGGHHFGGVMQAGFGAERFRVDTILPVDDVAMKRIFDKRTSAFHLRTKDPLAVGFVVGEQGLRAGVGVEIARSGPILERNVFERMAASVIGMEH